MPRRRGVLGPPNGYLAPDGVWPDGPFQDDTPQTVLVAAQIAGRLRDVVAEAGLNVTQVSDGLGIARSTYYDIVSNGATLPDLHTIVRAEAFLNTRLWPRA
ncbi:MAG TPA: helix-turn-helix transcriptional regulator [Jatrophihabitans sp.]|uniref:helix-turn-helix domain-containing protein n=1 Tax=Jatrophihabitans sp. TaxID=1932789 RepID=UPI002EE9F612